MVTTLLDLPPELIARIAQEIHGFHKISRNDVWRLMKCSKALYMIGRPILYSKFRLEEGTHVSALASCLDLETSCMIHDMEMKCRVITHRGQLFIDLLARLRSLRVLRLQARDMPTWSSKYLESMSWAPNLQQLDLSFEYVSILNGVAALDGALEWMAWIRVCQNLVQLNLDLEEYGHWRLEARGVVEQLAVTHDSYRIWDFIFQVCNLRCLRPSWYTLNCESDDLHEVPYARDYPSSLYSLFSCTTSLNVIEREQPVQAGIGRLFPAVHHIYLVSEWDQDGCGAMDDAAQCQLMNTLNVFSACPIRCLTIDFDLLQIVDTEETYSYQSHLLNDRLAQEALIFLNDEARFPALKTVQLYCTEDPPAKAISALWLMLTRHALLRPNIKWEIHASSYDHKHLGQGIPQETLCMTLHGPTVTMSQDIRDFHKRWIGHLQRLKASFEQELSCGSIQARK